MNADAETPSSDESRITYTYDSENRLIMTSERITSLRVTTYNDPAEPRAERFKFEHDTRRRLFLLTGPDGKIRPSRQSAQTARTGISNRAYARG